MAATRITEDGPSAGGPDDLDALLSYDLDEADTRAFELASAQAPQHANTNPPSSTNPLANPSSSSTNLNLNEEVKIVKRREPVAKLDESRLLSAAGIPKLRVMAGGVGDRKSRKGVSKGLGIRGKKGEEFEDVARMLARYQLWMDDLYPRAKMADALVIVEKLGHSKRMQMLRKEWIDEGKPGRDNEVDGEREDRVAEVRLPEGEREVEEQGEVNGGVMITGDTAGGDNDDSDDGGMFVPMVPGSGGKQATAAAANDDVPMDDELDALLAEDGSRAASASAPATTSTGTAQSAANATSRGGDDVPMDDDLDALLAEEDAVNETAPNNGAVPSAEQNKNTMADSGNPTTFEDDYADDMEAMGDMW